MWLLFSRHTASRAKSSPTGNTLQADEVFVRSRTKKRRRRLERFLIFFLGSSAASFRGKTLHLLQTTKPSQVTTEVLFRGSFQLSVRRFPPVKPNLIFKQSISLTSPPSDGANHINRLSAYSYRNVFFFFYFEI